jgi:hypothetical protein
MQLSAESAITRMVITIFLRRTWRFNQKRGQFRHLRLALIVVIRCECIEKKEAATYWNKKLCTWFKVT